MEVMITGKQLDVTPALKEFLESRVKKIEKYTSKATQITFTLKVEKYRHLAEVLLKVNGYILQSEQETDEMYASVDKAMSKIERQLKKHKEKLCDHRLHQNNLPEEAAPPIDWADNNIKKRKRHKIEAMSIEDAALQMELLDNQFFLFNSQEKGQLSVLYRRKDGSLGLIEPVV